MGLLSKLFGGKEAEYPALDSASAGAQRIEKFRLQLESLVKKINDKYEAVPADNEPGTIHSEVPLTGSTCFFTALPRCFSSSNISTHGNKL